MFLEKITLETWMTSKKYARDTYGWIGGKVPSNEAANDDSTRKSKSKPISIERNEDWATVWLKLQSIGWVLRSRKHKKKVVKYWYIKSGSTMQQGKRGRDYFVSDAGFKKYVSRRYGWIGEEKIVKKRKIIVKNRIPEKIVVVKNRVPARSPRVKEVVSKTHSRTHSSTFGSEQDTSVNDERLVHDDTEETTPFSANQFTWSAMWERLIELGWTFDKIRKYQYAVPGENIMLFERREELIDYVRSYHGWVLVAKNYSKKKQKV